MSYLVLSLIKSAARVCHPELAYRIDELSPVGQLPEFLNIFEDSGGCFCGWLRQLFSTIFSTKIFFVSTLAAN